MKDSQNEVFRKVALERLSSPEQLDQLLEVTGLGSWLTLAGMFLLLLGALAWGMLGSVPTLVEGEGILMRQGGLIEVRAPDAGRIELDVGAGEVIEKGAVLAMVHPPPSSGGGPFELVAPHEVRVAELLVDEGQTVAAGTPVLSLERAAGELVVVLFVPSVEGRQVKPGMKARISPRGVAHEQHGYLTGKVRRVAEIPASEPGLRRFFADSARVAELLDRDLRIRLEIVLEPDPAAPSGLRWSASQGPDLTLGSRTDVTGHVVLRRDRPLAQVFPWLRTEMDA